MRFKARMEQDRQAGWWLAKPVGVVFFQVQMVRGGRGELQSQQKQESPAQWRRSPLGSVLRKHGKPQSDRPLGFSRWHFLSSDSSGICKVSISEAAGFIQYLPDTGPANPAAQPTSPHSHWVRGPHVCATRAKGPELP